MVLCHQWQPARYPAGEQLIAFLYACLVVVLIARLAGIVAQMNEGLRTQQRELASALEKVRQLATRDDLTQVHNRRHITELMRIEQAQHERSGSPLCAALLDIDFFKVVTTASAPPGDDVLRRFAQPRNARCAPATCWAAGCEDSWCCSPHLHRTAHRRCSV